ncbi:hypothetical protein QDT91_29585 (plasmid) [Mycolicibacterium aubagnense]|uniref:hypothetical protein n=1 Tax=Mycolicibacterium aubagnense TaxID=319707 RepID=UPI00244DCD4B|nr:hypothetical protein [Mycolicibacterium aubagnense]WGI36171.1 hypothetical protein QDT91_29585 [Mycolicibacterium aubagnense]
MDKSNNIDRLLDHVDGLVRRFHVAFPDVQVDDFLNRITYWREPPGLAESCARAWRAAVADMRAVVAELPVRADRSSE